MMTTIEEESLKSGELPKMYNHKLGKLEWIVSFLLKT